MPVMRMTHSMCYKNAGYTAFRHYVPEKVVMSVTLNDCVKLVKLINKIKDYEPIVLHKFRTLKCMKKEVHSITVQGQLKMIEKFEKKRKKEFFRR